jgi:hypothetical protein
MYELNVGIIEHQTVAEYKLNNWFKICMLWRCIADYCESLGHAFLSVWEAMFHIYTTQMAKIYSVYFNLCTFRQEAGKQVDLNRFYSDVKFLRMQFLFISVIPRHLDPATLLGDLLAVFTLHFTLHFFDNKRILHTYYL